jgi:hypothetical protein
MTILKKKIAEEFDECMGYWEGIKVPDHTEGHRSIDYANNVLKLIVSEIDSIWELNEIKYGNTHGQAAIIFYNKIKGVLK